MSDPNPPRRVSATVKVPESERYKGDAPWIVLEGSDPETVKQLVAEAFRMEDIDELSLFDVVLNAEQQAVATANAARGLSGTVTKSGGSAWKKAKEGQSSEKPKEPEKTPEELERERLAHEVEQAKTRDELKQLWARNQEAFKDEGLMAAWKAKGKSLAA